MLTSRLLPVLAAAVLLAAPALGQDLGQEDDPELRRLLEADQAARQDVEALLALPPDSALAFQRADSLRRARVLDLLAEGRVRTGADHYHAALVLQHGGDSTAYRQAYALSRAAVERGYEEARGLVPRAYDRWRLALGEAQVYGTQYEAVGGTWRLIEPFDPEGIEDRERLRWGVPPVAVTRAFLACLNDGGDFEACAEEMAQATRDAYEATFAP